MSKPLPRNVWILTLAQALIMTVNSVIVFAGGLVGAELAPKPGWATLPVALTVVGTALSTVPVSALMKRLGRRRTFLLVTSFSILIALLAALAVSQGSFYMFCFSTLLFGITSATVMQFRFAAMESVEMDQVPQAASTVLLGGIAAAFLGPETAVWGKELMGTDYVGSFLLLGILFASGLVALQFFKNPVAVQSGDDGAMRSIKAILKQKIFIIALSSAIVGYAIMTFIMTATPVSMHVMDGHSLHHTKWVIQSHIVAMFLPSLITPKLIHQFGIRKVMISGLAAYLICIGIGYAGHAVPNYWISLILLGVGWNFLFIGGTSLLPQAYRPAERFRVQAVNDFGVFGTQAIASLSAGWFIFTLGWEVLLFSTVPIIAMQIVVLSRWKN